MKLTDVVALEMDPMFRDRSWQARQYGRVLDIRDGVGGYRCGTYATVSWSDIGVPEGPWTPKTSEVIHVDALRVIHAGY
jgi:hypothetical protein